MIPTRIPDVTFHTRIRNAALGGPNPFEWKELTSEDVFGGIVLLWVKTTA